MAQIRTFRKNVYTYRFSTGKPKFCNDHTYQFHASESLNLIFPFLQEGGVKGGNELIHYIPPIHPFKGLPTLRPLYECLCQATLAKHEAPGNMCARSWAGMP